MLKKKSKKDIPDIIKEAESLRKGIKESKVTKKVIEEEKEESIPDGGAEKRVVEYGKFPGRRESNVKERFKKGRKRE